MSSNRLANEPKTMLTIAGFDPSSGAGVTADLAVFAAFGFFGTSCITALTVQSTVGVRRVEAVGAKTVGETLRCLDEDLPAAGVKIGMLATAENVETVAAFVVGLRSFGQAVPIVLDPVLRSSSGKDLLSEEGLEVLRGRLMPRVDWVTPNLAELGVLIGRKVETAEEMESGALELAGLFPGVGIVVKGGHLAESDAADDLVVSADGSLEWLRGIRIESRATHGTGCAFSSAMVCSLVEGRSGIEAARVAKNFVAEAIRSAVPMGRGFGPMNLLWSLRRGEESAKRRELGAMKRRISAANIGQNGG